MSWIKIITYNKAEGKLKKLYNRIKGPNNYIDNIMLVHSLRPNTLEGHMSVYKNAIHHQNNQLPKWFLEAIGAYVSSLNNCSYCVAHHFSGMARELNDEGESSRIREALEDDQPELYFKDKQLNVLYYVKKLTQSPGSMIEQDILELRNTGSSDGEILEINQIVAYFAYANRTVLGLGVNTKGEIIGLSPNHDNEEDNWQHN